MKLLHIDSSILGANSISRQVSAAVVERLQASDPSIDVTYRDLAAGGIDQLTAANLPSEASGADAALAEFLDADLIVLGVPTYNFGVPSQLKAWIDRIVVAGKTFRYGEAGPVGLAADKRVIVALARGGPADFGDHVEPYLRTILGFIGVTEPEFIIAQGVMMGPEARATAIDGALAAAGELRAA